MRKVVILTLVTLFTCVEYSQAQTIEKEMTRQEKKAAQEALDKMLFQEAKEAIDNQTFVYWKRTEFTLNTEPPLSFHPTPTL